MYLPTDINELRKLLASGAISQSDLSNMSISGQSMPQQNALAQAVAPSGMMPQQTQQAQMPSEQQAYAAAVQQTPYDPQVNSQDGLPTNSMRNNDSGQMTYFAPSNAPQGFSDNPYPNSSPLQAASAAQFPNPVAQGGTQAPQVMGQGSQQGMMRVIGSGNGVTMDLGSQPAQAVPIDYRKGQIDVPGVGRGYYGTDGNAYVANPD